MNISTKENSFYITNTQIDSIKLVSNNQCIVVSKHHSQFSLDIELLESLNLKKNQPIELLNQNNKPIEFHQNHITFNAHSYVKVGKKTYYLYINEANHLSLIYNKKPSIMLYYNKDAQFKGGSVDKHTIKLEVTFSNKFFQPTSASLQFKVRSKDIKLHINHSTLKSTQTENTYETTAQFHLTKEDLTSLLDETIHIDTFNPNIYDCRFNFQIDEFELSMFMPRVQFDNAHKYLLNDEHWLELNESTMLLFRSYPTQNNNLSFRLSLISKDIFSLYNDETAVRPLSDNQKKTILCIEYPEKAQDNGFIFFKYLMKKHSDKYNIFYLISKDSPDLENLKDYKGNVVIYHSIEHLRLLSQVDMIFHTHSSMYSLPFYSNKFEKLLKDKNKVFLQHGITASDYVKHLYSKDKENGFCDLFIVSSQREKDLVVTEYGYDPDEVVVSGFARFDNLIKERKLMIKRFKNRKKVLIIPTWRKSLNLVDEETFKESDYYQAFQKLINHPSLKILSQKNNFKFTFYVHRNFQKFSHLFSSDFIHITNQSETTVRNLLYNHQIMITDYSSVGLDFALMHKKVVYYRPSLLNHDDMTQEPEGFLPGSIVHDIESLVMEITQSKKIDKQHLLNLHQLYEYNDTRACDRIFQAAKEKLDL